MADNKAILRVKSIFKMFGKYYFIKLQVELLMSKVFLTKIQIWYLKCSFYDLKIKYQILSFFLNYESNKENIFKNFQITHYSIQ